MKKEITANAVILLMAVAGFAYTLTFKRTSDYRLTSSVTGAAWPQMLLGGIIVLSLVLIIQELIKVRRAGANTAEQVPQEAVPPEVQRRATLRMLLTFAALLAFAIVTPIVGFILSTFLVQIAILRVLETTSPKVLFGVPLIVTGTVFLIFIKGLGMMLPRGIGPFLFFSRLFY